MSLGRQGSLFVAVGLTQLAFDWLVFVVLTAAGMPVVAGNLLARVSAAGLGFWLNGRYTFADGRDARLGGARLLRFAVLWLGMTALSTLAVERLASGFGLGYAWLAKPVVEALLAVASFTLQRQWVYR